MFRKDKTVIVLFVLIVIFMMSGCSKKTMLTEDELLCYNCAKSMKYRISSSESFELTDIMFIAKPKNEPDTKFVVFSFTAQGVIGNTIEDRAIFKNGEYLNLFSESDPAGQKQSISDFQKKQRAAQNIDIMIETIPLMELWLAHVANDTKYNNTLQKYDVTDINTEIIKAALADPDIIDDGYTDISNSQDNKISTTVEYTHNNSANTETDTTKEIPAEEVESNPIAQTSDKIEIGEKVEYIVNETNQLLEDFGNLLDDSNSKQASVDDIHRYEDQWKNKYEDLVKIKEEMSIIKPEDDLIKVWGYALEMLDLDIAIAQKLSDFDSNGDGEYYAEDIISVLSEAKDMAVNQLVIPLEKLRSEADRLGLLNDNGSYEDSNDGNTLSDNTSSNTSYATSNNNSARLNSSEIFHGLEITDFSWTNGNSYGTMKCRVKNNNPVTVQGYFNVDFYDSTGHLVYSQFA